MNKGDKEELARLEEVASEEDVLGDVEECGSEDPDAEDCADSGRGTPEEPGTEKCDEERRGTEEPASGTCGAASCGVAGSLLFTCSMLQQRVFVSSAMGGCVAGTWETMTCEDEDDYVLMKRQVWDAGDFVEGDPVLLLRGGDLSLIHISEPTRALYMS